MNGEKLHTWFCHLWRTVLKIQHPSQQNSTNSPKALTLDAEQKTGSKCCQQPRKWTGTYFMQHSCKGNPHFHRHYHSPTIPAPSAAGSHGPETSISDPYLSSLVV
jgi:hypothetical protein